ncbi:hypothetical protein TNCV_3175801 [Trichonephila clavipes]|nr:hypothetical protein TNCV_3175801 [Trichonephila clavipes]
MQDYKCRRNELRCKEAEKQNRKHINEKTKNYNRKLRPEVICAIKRKPFRLNGLRSRRPLRRYHRPHIIGSVDWIFADLGATWSVTDWRRVIFSDESRFSLSADDHRTRV